MHAVVAVEPAKVVKLPDGKEKYDEGEYKCQAWACNFSGPISEAIGHTIQNQPDFTGKEGK